MESGYVSSGAKSWLDLPEHLKTVIGQNGTRCLGVKGGTLKKSWKGGRVVTAGSLANIADFYINYKEIWTRDSRMLKYI